MKRALGENPIEIQVIESLCMSLRSHRWIVDHLTYVKSDLDPADYDGVSDFKLNYVIFSLLRKWKGFEVDVDKSAVAFATWKKSETLCFLTNRRLEFEASTGFYSVAPAVIITAQRKIQQILGRLDIDCIAPLCRFGNGATVDLRRGSTHAEKSCKPSVTLEALPLVCQMLADDEYLGGLVGGFNDLKFVDFNRMVMVPKSAKTDRPIAAEPTLNGFVQQGFGRYLRARLKRFGVDLGDQTINQGLAQRALSEGLATLDLSSASDTLCTNLVKLLLPDEWYQAFSSLRCSKTQFQGKKYLLSKFSSMGNAFTFELESMIFYALVSATVEHGVTSVYGDDIIVSQLDYEGVVKTLKWAGFEVNYAKSFSVGSRYFESCGKHYYDGMDVTPCYQKDVCTRPHDYVRLFNRLVRAGIRLELRNEFQAAANIVLSGCRAKFGNRGTPSIGPLVEYDEYFIDEFYRWDTPDSDRVKLNSISIRNRKVLYGDGFQNFAYLGRKLRCPSFLNVDRDGQCSDTTDQVFSIKAKQHWRSASIAL